MTQYRLFTRKAMPKEYISARPWASEGENIVIPDYLLNSWIDEFPSGRTKLVKLMPEDESQSCIVSIGGTHSDEGIYVPLWILERLGIPDGAMYVTMEPYLE